MHIRPLKRTETLWSLSLSGHNDGQGSCLCLPGGVGSSLGSCVLILPSATTVGDKDTDGQVSAGTPKKAAASWVSGKRPAFSLVSPYFLLPAPSGEAVGLEEEDRVDQGCCRLIL